MTLKLKETFYLSNASKVELIVKGNPLDLQKIKNFIIFHEDLPEESIVEKLFRAFNDTVVSLEFKDVETFSTLWTNE